MGKHIRSQTRGILKSLGPSNPDLAANIAATAWERDLTRVVQTKGDVLRDNYIAGIRNYINNPQKQRIAQALLADWYNDLMNIIPRLRELWTNPETYDRLMQNLANAFRELDIEGLLRRQGIVV